MIWVSRFYIRIFFMVFKKKPFPVKVKNLELPKMDPPPKVERPTQKIITVNMKTEVKGNWAKSAVLKVINTKCANKIQACEILRFKNLAAAWWL